MPKVYNGRLNDYEGNSDEEDTHTNYGSDELDYDNDNDNNINDYLAKNKPKRYNNYDDDDDNDDNEGDDTEEEGEEEDRRYKKSQGDSDDVDVSADIMNNLALSPRGHHMVLEKTQSFSDDESSNNNNSRRPKIVIIKDMHLHMENNKIENFAWNKKQGHGHGHRHGH